MTEHEFDSNDWVPESGASTGDHRENDPALPGYASERDRVFRSHFQHANQPAERTHEEVHPVSESATEAIETDRENGWLNVRTSRGSWQAVRVFARAGFDAARQGSVEPYPETG